MNIKGYNVDKYDKRVIYTLRDPLGIGGSSLKYLAGFRFESRYRCGSRFHSRDNFDLEQCSL